MRKLFTLLVFLYLLLPTIYTYSQNIQEDKLPLIIDSDGDVDDMIALLYLFQTNKVDIKLISTTGNGKCHTPFAARNMLNFLEYSQNTHIPVSLSHQSPLSPIIQYPEEWREAADSCFGMALPTSIQDPTPEDSIERIYQTLMSVDSKVNILCTGPLTNIAVVLRNFPDVKSKINRIYCLAGALNVLGNVSIRRNGFYNRYAEYNMLIDVKAAQTVFNSGIPITLIPLDVLKNISPMMAEIYRGLLKNKNKNKNTEFIFSIMEPFNYGPEANNINFWSSFAAALILNPEIGNIMNLNINVYSDFGAHYGVVSIERVGFPIDVCVSSNYGMFFMNFLETITN